MTLCVGLHLKHLMFVMRSQFICMYVYHGIVNLVQVLTLVYIAFVYPIREGFDVHTVTTGVAAPTHYAAYA